MSSIKEQSPCIRNTEISDYVNGRLSNSAAEDLETHAADCDECAEQLENAISSAPVPRWFSSIRELMADETTARTAKTLNSRVAEAHTVAPMRFSGRSSQYSRVHLLASGGMGVVWKGWDSLTNRAVALKQLTSVNSDLRGVQRLIREARALARLSHPHVVAVYDIITDETSPLLVMEYVDGMTIAGWQQGQPVSAAEATELLVVISAALQHAHTQGVIHRDLKPSNILLQTHEPRRLPRDDSGQLQLKIADFGIARISGESTFTVSGQPLGTPSYMSPEQISGLTEDAVTTDIYACGVILYELLTGRPPFVASDPAVALNLIQTRDPAPLRLLQPHLPRDLETICLKCLSRRPHDRYHSVEMLAADLQAFRDGRPIKARPVGLLTRMIRWSARNRTVAVLLFSTAISLVAATVISLQAVRHQKQAADVLRKSEQKALAAAREEERLRKRAEAAEKAERQKASAESILRGRHLSLLLKMIRASDTGDPVSKYQDVIAAEVMHDFVLSLNKPAQPLSWTEVELVVRYLSAKRFSLDTSGLGTALARLDQAFDSHESNPENPEEFVEFLRIRQQFFLVSDDPAENAATNCRRWLRVAASFLQQSRNHPTGSSPSETLLAARSTALQRAYSAALSVREFPWGSHQSTLQLLQQVASAVAEPLPGVAQPRDSEKAILDAIQKELQPTVITDGAPAG
jgi:serine/threonine protein kinase